MLEHTRFFQKVKDETVSAGYLSEELALFYEDLFVFHEQNSSDGNNFDLSQCIDASTFPALDPEKFIFEGELKTVLEKQLRELLEIIEKHHPGIDTSLIQNAIEDKWSLLNTSVILLLQHDMEKLAAAADEVKIGLDEYLFILVNWMKPIMHSFSSAVMENVDTEEWLAPVCPFCGYLPDMSKIIEGRDNRRELHCGVCEHEWYYPRMTCAICENTDKDTLGFLNTSDESPYRVDYCDQCKGYIKTLRIPKLNEESRYDLAVENVVTTYLDASAIELGYKRL